MLINCATRTSSSECSSGCTAPTSLTAPGAYLGRGHGGARRDLFIYPRGVRPHRPEPLESRVEDEVWTWPSRRAIHSLQGNTGAVLGETSHTKVSRRVPRCASFCLRPCR